MGTEHGGSDDAGEHHLHNATTSSTAEGELIFQKWFHLLLHLRCQTPLLQRRFKTPRVPETPFVGSTSPVMNEEDEEKQLMYLPSLLRRTDITKTYESVATIGRQVAGETSPSIANIRVTDYHVPGSRCLHQHLPPRQKSKACLFSCSFWKNNLVLLDGIVDAL